MKADPQRHSFLKEPGYNRISNNNINTAVKNITDDIKGSIPGSFVSLNMFTPAKFNMNAKSTGAKLPIFPFFFSLISTRNTLKFFDKTSVKVSVFLTFRNYLFQFSFAAY